MINNPIINAIVQRRSVKSYLPTQIKDEELDTVLVAGTYAPTGMNKQSPQIVAIQDANIIKSLSSMNAAVMGNFPGDPFYGAPTVVVVFGNPEVRTWLEDASLVAGNMLNAAHAIGLGGCWIHRAKEVFATPEGQVMMRQWGVPEHFVGVANIVLGYQDQPAKPRIARRDDYIIKIK
ncbi:MAG: nitroreductase [Bacteroidales bacterium]|nr:nitroreductase [Bacteroidales bacterium]